MSEKLINIKDPDTGQIGSVPASQVNDALNQGYQEVTADDISQYVKEQKFGTPGQQLLTGVEGVSQGVLGPLATIGENALSNAGIPGLTPEERAAREEINPGIAKTTNIGGFAGSMLTGVGEAALLERAGIKGASAIGLRAEEIGQTAYEAAKAAGATTKAARAAKEAALAGEGITAVGKIGSSAARAATEMALYQAGDELSKKISTQPDLTLGSAMADVGSAGVLGLLGGGALASISPLWKASVGDRLGNFLGDFRARINQHLENPEPASALSDELGNFVKSTGAAADDVYGAQGLKARGIKQFLPETNERILTQVNDINATLGNAIKGLKDDPFVGKLQNAVDKYQSVITEPGAGSAEIFDATNTLKQQLQEWGKYNKALVPLAERDFREAAKNLAFKMRSALEDPEVWGKAADVQTKLNKAFSEYLPALKDFQKKFTSEVAGERVVDPGKIQTYMNQAGKLGQQTKQTMLGNYLEAAKKYRSAIDDVYKSIGEKSPIEEASLHHAQMSLENLSPGAKLADLFVKKGASRLGGDLMGAAVGGALGHEAGHGWVGALIGEHALGPFLSSVLPGIIKPLLEKAPDAAGLKAAADYGMAAYKGDLLMNRLARGVMIGGEKLNTPDHVDTKKLDKKLTAIKENPGVLLQSDNELGHYLPEHAVEMSRVSVQAANFLNSLRPDTDKKMPFDQKIPADPVKEERYQRALQISMQPSIVMRSVRDGTINSFELQVLQNVAPGFYAGMREKLMNEMINHVAKDNVIPYKTRIGIALFMGQPLDTTMLPQSIVSAQPMAPMGGGPQNMAQARAPSATSMQKLSKIGPQYATQGQQREMGRAKHLS